MPNRSADIFADLVHLLRGYPLHIRDEEHRQALLRDCRYFQFRGLEQQLIPHDIHYNHVRETTELLIRMEDVQTSALSVSTAEKEGSTIAGYAHYQRPFVDQVPQELLLEIGHGHPIVSPRALKFRFNSKSTPETRFLLAVWNKAVTWLASEPGWADVSSSIKAQGPPDGSKNSGGRTPITVYFHPDAHITLNGRKFTEHHDDPLCDCCPAEPPELSESGTLLSDKIVSLGDECAPTWTGFQPEEWHITKGQWRIRVEAKKMYPVMNIALVAVKLDAHTEDGAHNARRSFLGA